MPEEPTPSFEDALDRVERIVADLERGEPSLTAALGKYEEGVRLLRGCYDLLDQAERSVALLTGVDDQGRPETAPFDDAATAPSADPGPPRGKPRKRRPDDPPSDPGPPEGDDIPF
jgi:exodeoxyribonuclease VII small subunit